MCGSHDKKEQMVQDAAQDPWWWGWPPHLPGAGREPMPVAHPCTGLTSLPVAPREPSLDHSLWAAGLQEQSAWASQVGTELRRPPLPHPHLSPPASVGHPVLSLQPGHGGQQVRLS